jgi:hypothetical protein
MLEKFVYCFDNYDLEKRTNTANTNEVFIGETAMYPSLYRNRNGKEAKKWNSENGMQENTSS